MIIHHTIRVVKYLLSEPNESVGKVKMREFPCRTLHIVTQQGRFHGMVLHLYALLNTFPTGSTTGMSSALAGAKQREGVYSIRMLAQQ
jgi:hypothetical protein